jgi:hypothetical protein
MRRLAIVALMAMGCSSSGTRSLVLQEDVGQLSEALIVNLRSYDDSRAGGAGAVALNVWVANVSDEMLSGCQLWLGEELKASFGDLRVHRGFFGRDEPRGHSDLRGGESISFLFNHDNRNYLISRGGGGSKELKPGIPASITVVCGERRAKWRVSP